MVASNELWDEVAMSVCSICVDHANGACRLRDPDDCTLRSRFGEVVAAVSSVHDERFGPYVIALRERVCSDCRHQLPLGRCNVRDGVGCALDRYYALVIEAIEDALQRR
jgi:hypothetical protein